jgi:hypothetical protein
MFYQLYVTIVLNILYYYLIIYLKLSLLPIPHPSHPLAIPLHPPLEVRSNSYLG